MKMARPQSGFTLIELLVVIALIGIMSVFAMPNVSSFFRLSMNKAIREMAGLVRETYNSTAMTGKVHRLVYDFKASQFWVESGPAHLLLDTAETRDKEERRKRLARPGEEPPKPQFTMDTTITRKKISLPDGVVFEDILTEQSPEPLIEGTAFTHFFPHGLTEQTIIHLKDQSKHQTTLVIFALTGRTQLIEGYAKPEEIYDKK